MRRLAGLGSQLVGYGFGAVGAPLVLMGILFGEWLALGVGAVLFAIGTYFILRGEDLES